MDAADLDYRTRTYTACIPPHLVWRLVELGHTDEVEFQAGRGEWFCAQEQTRLLAEQDRRAEALEVLAPYVATGWWKAVEAMAGTLEEWGRNDEAIVLTRPHAEAGERSALNFFARLLTRNGRADEAFDLLRPHVEDWWLAAALVDVAEAAGRDEDALVRHGRGEEATEVLRSLADAPGGAENWIVDMLCTHYADQGRPEDGLVYLDALKERDGEEAWEFFRIRLPLLVACGRREEAIELAMAHPERDTWAIAELLADAGRTEEAVALLEQDDGGSILADYLIDLGRIKEAVAILQRPKPSPTKLLQVDDPTHEPPF